MTVTPEQVRRLREITGAGVMDAKQALARAGGDIATATELLRKQGRKIVAAKASRASKDGLIEAYVHPNRKLGVLVDVRCETDFVARNEDFRAFVHELALQVAAANPRWLRPEDIPADVLDKEREIAREQIRGKPANVVAKIVAGKLEKFASEVCLLKQPSIRDDAKTVEQLLHDIIAKVGENVVIQRFIRYSLDEG